MIVVLDVNVFVSAILSRGGTASRLVAAAERGAIDLVVSPLLLAELTRALGRDRFRPNIPLVEIPEYCRGLVRIGRLEPDPPATAGLTRDPGDDYLVTLALAVRADLLVSADKDLLEAGLGSLAVSPRTALERLR